MSTALRMTAREWGMLTVLSILWGGAFFFASLAVREMTPVSLAFARVLIAALTLGATARLIGLTFPVRFAEWRAFAILALFSNALPFVLLYWAQTRITGGLASVLNAMTPIFTLFIAHLFTQDEKIGLRRLAGIVAGVLGVTTVVGPSALAGHSGQLWAEIAVLGAAFCYGVAAVYGRRFSAYPPIITAFAQLSTGSALLLPAALIGGAPFPHGQPGLITLASVIALGVLGTALAFGLFFRILLSAGAANAALVTLLVPVSAILLGVVFLGDELVARQYAGLAMIAAGLLIIDGRLLAFFSRQVRASA